MASKQLTRRQKALIGGPLALLCGAWSISIAVVGSASADAKPGDGKLPDGTSVPTEAIQAPASVPQAGVIAPGVPRGTANQVVDSASTSGIPSAALSAYQRAAQIIDSADKTCHVPWELIAAIGRVESDHGRYGGNVLSAKGVSTPGIYGIELNGKNGTQEVQDTDGGALDKDPVYDRAVGPMQFIPSTWQVVKVDADGDGKRNPQDIDDASLASAVYLCSGSNDLGTAEGQQSAVYRYNHSKSYVDLVLRIMRAYQSGDYTAVPNDTSGGGVLAPSGTTALKAAEHKAHAKQHHNHGKGSSGSGGSTSGTGTTGTTGTGTLPSTGGGTGNGLPKLPLPTKLPIPTKAPVPAPVVKTLNQLGQTASYCRGKLGSLKGVPGAMGACSDLVGPKTLAEANGLLGGKTPKQVLALLGIKLPLGL